MVQIISTIVSTLFPTLKKLKSNIDTMRFFTNLKTVAFDYNKKEFYFGCGWQK